MIETSALVKTYQQMDVHFKHGDGCLLFDQDGKRYIDFAAGIGVSSLGHNHPELTQALQNQASQLLHASNLYRIDEQEEVAQALCSLSSASDYRAFFCNSGAEANEAAIKIARRYHFTQSKPERNVILTLEGGFHGRTLATIFAVGKKHYTDGFGPALPGFGQIKDLKANTLASLSDPKIAAVMIEPIQGEQGIVVFPAQELRDLKEACTRNGVLLIMDEVQSGNARTGMMWAHQHAGVVPDIVTTAKGLGGGIPVAATLVRENIAKCMQPGLHGSTFGGNLMAMSAAKTVLSVIKQEPFLDNVTHTGQHLSKRLQDLKRRFQQEILEIRGVGLMQGIQLHEKINVRRFVGDLVKRGLLCVPASHNTLRFLPPLIIETDLIDEGIDLIEQQLSAR